MPASHRLAVRVRPGASRTRVGGWYGEAAAGSAALVVAVGARAVDGAATEAVLAAVAEALGVRRRQVVLVHGRTSRDKLLEILDPPPDVAARIEALGDAG
ncbi:MAG: DUF167 domain-containing protein [Frankiales bacterium]|nr:DUF167 domain-containing protein [Frankiales bacterium]